MSGEPKTQEPNNDHHKCRIPQRLAVRQKTLKSKAPPNENVPRPKSANRASEAINETTPSAPAARPARPDWERISVLQKEIYIHRLTMIMMNMLAYIRESSMNIPRVPTYEPTKYMNNCLNFFTHSSHYTITRSPPVHKKNVNEKCSEVASNKARRQIITVPIRQKYAPCLNKLSANLPDQETIKRCEDMELHQDFSDAAQMQNSIDDIFLGFNEEESITSQSERMIHMKTWQEKIVKFEEMKSELNDRQNGILEIYASLRNTKHKLTAMGQTPELPSTDDLKIMNVANMTPYQLLQLCAETKSRKDDQQMAKNTLTIDMKKLDEMPFKLVATCEQTLATRKELIDWFENVKNQEGGCTKSSLSKKINEFKAESEMLSSTLQSVKTEFLRELNDFLRSCWNESVGLQLRNEELVCEVSELNSQNADLEKKLHNAEKQKAQVNKIRFEELEKELNQERVKKITMRDRLSRAEGQVKIEEERATLLEASLNQARTQTRTLERTVQQLNEQKQQLQNNFDDELNKLKESMKKNTTHLEEIAKARETLQQEKKYLKKTLEELSNHYNESLSNTKQELSKNIVKVIEAEKKYNDEMEEKKILQKTIESQCAHLLEYELRHKDLIKKLHETETTSSVLLNHKKDFETTKYKLDECIADLEKNKKLITEKDEKLKIMEENLKESHEVEKELKSEINNKEILIASLNKKQDIIQQQLQENEYKMETYEEQLTTLKNHIIKLQEHFVDFENLNELRDLVNQENAKLNQTRLENEALSDDLQKKRCNLKHLIETIAEQEDLMKQRHNMLQMLSEKEEEKSNVIQLNQIINEKNAEIESLMKNIDTRKEQISQLEKIVLTIEDQNRKGAVQRRRDQDKIHNLEKKIAEYEYYLENKNNGLASPENLDHLIKILEDELATSFEPNLITTTQSYDTRKNGQSIGNQNNYHKTDYYGEKLSNYQQQNNALPTKIVMGNFVKKTYIPNNDDKIYNNDNHLHRKQAITNIETQKWIPASDVENSFDLPPSYVNNNSYMCDNAKNQVRHPKEKLLQTLQFTIPNQARDEKKLKMFKFACHRQG